MATPRYEHVIIVTRKTELDDLVARFNTRAQARFYLEQAGHAFEAIEVAHEKHGRVLGKIRQAIPRTMKQQVIDREMVPRFTFGEADLVVTVGQDGLVSNTAKYLTGQPILAVNPDPERFDGVLLPFTVDTMGTQLHETLYGTAVTKQVTLAKAELTNGQSLLAFNDFFIGAKSHVSARYRIEVGGRAENHSSSGIIVSTGAGSTGWLQSVYAGAAGIVEALGGSIVHGAFTNDAPLHVTSQMANNGVIFSDGVEADYLEFNAGAELTVMTAPEQARLIIPATEQIH
jgi:NAD kinase